MIAERWGLALTPACVRQILAVGAAEIPADGLDPVQVAYERRSQFEEILEKALALADEIPASNASCGRSGRRASATAGTIFHATRTPLTVWFAD